MGELAHFHGGWYDILSLVDRFDLIDLKQKALDTMAGDFHAIWRRRAFLELDESLVIGVLARSDLVVEGECTVFDASL